MASSMIIGIRNYMYIFVSCKVHDHEALVRACVVEVWTARSRSDQFLSANVPDVHVLGT